MPRLRSLQELIEKHRGQRSIIATNEIKFEHVPTIVKEGLLTPVDLERRGSAAPGRRGREYMNLYHVDQEPSQPHEPSIPFGHVFVKLPRNARWVSDERNEIPLEHRTPRSPKFQQARIQAHQSIEPRKIIAFRLSFAAHHKTSGFRPIRAPEIVAFLTRTVEGKLSADEVERKTDAELVNHLKRVVGKITRKKAIVEATRTENNLSVRVPWIDLAIALAHKHKVPVYGWDGNRIAAQVAKPLKKKRLLKLISDKYDEEELKPTEPHTIVIDGQQTDILLPKGVISNPRIFLHIRINGVDVPCYLSVRRGDFRVGFITIGHNSKQVSKIVKTDLLAAAEKLKKLKRKTLKMTWVIKFPDNDAQHRSTRLRQEIQDLLRSKLGQMKVVKINERDFARHWLKSNFGVPDADCLTGLKSSESGAIHNDFLRSKLAPLSDFIHKNGELIRE